MQIPRAETLLCIPFYLWQRCDQSAHNLSDRPTREYVPLRSLWQLIVMTDSDDPLDVGLHLSISYGFFNNCSQCTMFCTNLHWKHSSLPRNTPAYDGKLVPFKNLILRQCSAMRFLRNVLVHLVIEAHPFRSLRYSSGSDILFVPRLMNL